jgi:hypothetical protein
VPGILEERANMRLSLIVAGLIFAALLSAEAAAQSPPPVTQPPGTQVPVAAAAPAPKQLVVPSPEALLMMIRSTLIALHHGNVTGNYAVLRELSAPGFQTANSAANLNQIFTNLRTQRINLTPVLFLTPELTQGPAISENGMLTMTGFLATQPLRINFQLAFQAVDGVWRPFGIGINPVPAPKEAVAATSSTAATPAKATQPAAKQPPSGKAK